MNKVSRRQRQKLKMHRFIFVDTNQVNFVGNNQEKPPIPVIPKKNLNASPTNPGNDTPPVSSPDSTADETENEDFLFEQNNNDPFDYLDKDDFFDDDYLI